MPEVVESIDLPEIDGGTRIDRMDDGSLQLRMDMMPPEWARPGQFFDGFQDDLAAAIGAPVEGLDRELFRIDRPRADTVEAIRHFLHELKRQPAD